MGSPGQRGNDNSSVRLFMEWLFVAAFVVVIVAYVGSFLLIGTWCILTDARAPIEGSHGYQAAAVAHFKAGNDNKTVEYCEKSLRSQPSGHIKFDRGKSHYLLAEVYLKAGNDEQAMHNLKRAAVYQPREGYIYNRISRIMVKHGEYENAEKLIKVALALQPEEKEHLDVLAWLLRRRGAA